VSLLLTSLGLSVTLPPQLGPHHTMMFRLPSIGVAMQLMDVSGRCVLLLWTMATLDLNL